MLELPDILAIVTECSFPGLRFNLVTKGGAIFLQLECPDGVCTVTGTARPWKGRKWYISPHSTRSEVVQTAFKAVVTALEHEAREAFRFRDVAVLDPHIDLDNLVVVKSERVLAQ